MREIDCLAAYWAELQFVQTNMPCGKTAYCGRTSPQSAQCLLIFLRANSFTNSVLRSPIVLQANVSC